MQKDFAVAKQKNHKFYRRLFKSRKPRQSLADLARQNGIDPSQLYSYRAYLKRCGEESETVSSESPTLLPAFLPIVLKSRVTAPLAPSEAQTFDLTLEKLGTLTIPGDFEEAVLRRLLILVRSLPC
jgi:hypothetical protein